MSALGYACISLVGAIWGIGLILEESHPGAFAVMSVIAVFPAVVAGIDAVDAIMDRTVDRWLARRGSTKVADPHANKNFEEAA